jgi:hypothetical protein
MVVDLSIDSDYHTQVNNALVPMSSCNTTSAVMFLLAAGESLPDTGMQQPEDALTALSETPEAYDAVKRLAPWFWDRAKQKPSIPPRQIHVVLDWVVNAWMGRKVMEFKQGVPMRALAQEILARRPALLNGRFTKSGHIVCLSGLDVKDSAREFEVGMVSAWIVDDPYGDWRTGYASHKGNNTRFTTAELMSLLKDYDVDSKWAHFYVGGGA